MTEKKKFSPSQRRHIRDRHGKYKGHRKDNLVATGMRVEKRITPFPFKVLNVHRCYLFVRIRLITPKVSGQISLQGEGSDKRD